MLGQLVLATVVAVIGIFVGLAAFSYRRAVVLLRPVRTKAVKTAD